MIVRAFAISILLLTPIATESSGASATGILRVQPILHRWQTRLALGRWQIEARIVHRGSLGTDEDGIPTVANIVYDIGQRSAAICVEEAAYDELEEALIHELIHLKLAIWQAPVSPDDEEETVETIASALLTPRR